MKKTLLIAVLFCTLTASAQVPQAVADRLARDYNEEYTLVSIDTVAMPIRIVMSLNFLMSTELNKVCNKIGKLKDLQPANQRVVLAKMVSSMRKTLDETIGILDIVAMRDSNKPDKDDYYNYQRTRVYLSKSKREEIYYIRIGEEAISMTQHEYNVMEHEAFLKYWQYRDIMKDAQRLLERIR